MKLWSGAGATAAHHVLLERLFGHGSVLHEKIGFRSGLHLDRRRVLRARRSQSALPSPRPRNGARGVRELLTRVAMAPGAPFDYGEFEIREEPL